VTTPDPELEQLPPPRHPWRKTTIGALCLCFVLSVALVLGLARDIAFSAHRGAPADLGNLANATPSSAQANVWVKAEGELADHGGIRYERPLESGSFRLVPIEGNRNVWVQVRVPAGFEDEHFVPPTAFVGRLMKANELGIRYSAIREAVVDAGWPNGQLPAAAWVLIDGESPAALRWIIALAAVLIAFAAFSVWAMASVLRPARSA
jgi:hypothetical protein